MRNKELFSKEWCELIFESRNKEYGAYRLRSRAGRRNRFAVTVVFCIVFLLSVFPVATDLYVKYKALKSIKDINTEVKQLKKIDERDGFKVKHISAGRAAPTFTTIKGARNDAPEIVETTKQSIVFGTDGPETFIANNEVLYADMDSDHNANRTDLPIEGPQLTAVDVVEEMPQFPGGLPGLMEWLDKNVAYPQSCVRDKVEGDLEVTFYVNKTGRAVDAKITKKLHPDLDRAVLTAIKKMPRWQPGKKNSRISTVCITIPVHFGLVN